MDDRIATARKGIRVMNDDMMEDAGEARQIIPLLCSVVGKQSEQSEQSTAKSSTRYSSRAGCVQTQVEGVYRATTLPIVQYNSGAHQQRRTTVSLQRVWENVSYRCTSVIVCSSKFIDELGDASLCVCI